MGEKLDNQKIDFIQSNYNSKKENTFLYGKFSSKLESLKESKLTNPETIKSINDILKKLESENQIEQIGKYIIEIEELLNGFNEEKTQVTTKTQEETSKFNSGLPDLKTLKEKDQEKKLNEKYESFKEEYEAFKEELSKFEFKGEENLEDFKKELKKVLDDKKFSNIPQDLKDEMFKALISLKEAQEINLIKVNDFIDSLYDPNKDPKTIFFIDEEGRQQKREFNSPQEAQEFVKNLKFLVKDEIDKTFFQTIKDFFTDIFDDNFKEWFLPFTDINGLLKGKLKDWQDWAGLSFEIVFYGIGSILGARLLYNGPIESVTRRTKDFLGRWSNDASYTFDSTTVSNFQNSLIGAAIEDNDDLKILTKRHQIKQYLEYKGNLEADIAEKEKFFKEFNKINENFFFSRSNTYIYKMLKLSSNFGFGYDLKTIFLQGWKTVPALGENRKLLKPWTWLQFKPIDMEDQVMAKLFDDDFKQKTEDGAKLFFKDIVFEKNMIKSMTLDEEKLNKYKEYLEVEKKLAITKIEDYIKSLEKTKEPIEEITRKLYIFENHPSDIQDIKEIDTEINKLKIELNEKGKLNFKGKKEIKQKIKLLEDFKSKILNLNWIGDKTSFKENINLILGGTIKEPIKFTNITIPVDYDISKNIKRGEEIISFRESFLKFLDTDGNLEKIEKYILYIQPDKKYPGTNLSYEKHMGELLKGLREGKFSDINDYYRDLGEILNLQGITDFSDQKLMAKLQEIGQKLSEVENFYNNEYLKGKNVEEKLISYFGVEKKFWDDTIHKELEKFMENARHNNYSIGQASYIINEIFNLREFTSIISDDSNTIFNIELDHTNFKYSGNLNKLRENQKALETKQNLGANEKVDLKSKYTEEYNKFLESKGIESNSDLAKMLKRKLHEKIKIIDNNEQEKLSGLLADDLENFLNEYEVLEPEKKLSDLKNRTLASIELSNLDKEEKIKLFEEARGYFEKLKNEKSKNNITFKFDEISKGISSHLKENRVIFLSKTEIENKILEKQNILAELEKRGYKFDFNTGKLTGALDEIGISSEEASLARILRFLSKAL